MQPDEAALLCLLLLRGPQTPGELRGRADRLFAFDDVPQVQAALTRMTAPTTERTEALAAVLPRQPGAREVRYRQLLTGAGDEPSAAMTVASAAKQDGEVSASDLALQELRDEVAVLQERLATLETTVRTLIG